MFYWLGPIFAAHDDVIQWKHFPRHWPFVWGIHRSPVNSHHKGQWREALMSYLICTRLNDWVNNRGAGDLRRRRGHYEVTVMLFSIITCYHDTVRDIRCIAGSRWYVNSAFIYRSPCGATQLDLPCGIYLFCNKPTPTMPWYAML